MPRIEEIIHLEPKQQQALQAVGKYRYVYYGGARGGGKTHAACAIALHTAIRYPGANIVIMRETIEELRQYIVPTIEYILPSARWSKVYKFKERDKKYQFSNGSLIFLRPLKNIRDVYSEQGIERNAYILDEANNIPAEYIRRLDASLRNTRVQGLRPFMFMTGNPGGISDDYFLSHFVQPDYSRWTEEDLQQKHEYKFIQAYVYDNKYIVEGDPNYIRTLEALPSNLRAAWLEGRWDVFVGQFFEEWNEDVHTVKDFEIPRDWPRYRTIDLGRGSHASVCYWIAGDPDTGIHYVYRELVHKGSISDFARAIVLLSEGEVISRTFSDPNIFASNNQFYDMEQYFRAEGIILEKSSNDRTLGWRIMKQWLHWQLDGDEIIPPKLRFFRGTCPEAIRFLPMLRYAGDAKDDCDTRAIDDHADALRYFCIMIPYPSTTTMLSREGAGQVRLKSEIASFRDMAEAEKAYFSKKENLYFQDDDYSEYISPYSGGFYHGTDDW